MATPVVVFDVNETLSDMSPLAGRFAAVGAAPGLAATWFAAVLREGFALTTAGDATRFATIADAQARALLHGHELDRPLDTAVAHVLAGFGELSVHPDVPAGVRALAAAGARMVTFSNGAVAVAEGLLTRAGVRDAFEALLSVEDAGVWKPAAAAYRYVARTCGTDPDGLLMVAVHPWDLHGAARAGLRTAWLDRDGTPYPSYCARPDHVVRSVGELVTALT
jgi:2-haloacid dehalogenase